MGTSIPRKALLILYRPFSRPKARLTVVRLVCCILSVALVLIFLTKRSNQLHNLNNDGGGDDESMDGDGSQSNVISHPLTGSRPQLSAKEIKEYHDLNPVKKVGLVFTIWICCFAKRNVIILTTS